MSNSLPILGQVDPLDSDLVEKCSDGNCTQCGLCCIGYPVTVPSIQYDINSPLYQKARGEICPQLIRNHRGQYQCALHGEKMDGDPRLKVCKEWSGNLNRIIELSAITEIFAFQPKDLKSVWVLQDLLRRGLATIFTFEVTAENVSSIVLHYIKNLDICPIDIFVALRIQAAIKALYIDDNKKYQKLDRAIWEHSEDLYHAFFEEYVWKESVTE